MLPEYLLSTQGMHGNPLGLAFQRQYGRALGTGQNLGNLRQTGARRVKHDIFGFGRTLDALNALDQLVKQLQALC